MTGITRMTKDDWDDQGSLGITRDDWDDYG